MTIMTTTAKPFSDNISSLEAELGWLSKRCRRLACLRAARSASQESPHWEGAQDEELVAR